MIPAYEVERFVADAIESALAQTYDRVETVVVDDGSTDGTADVIARYDGIRTVRKPNGGLAAARNTGIGLARGEIVAFLDADDRLVPHAVERVVEYLAEHPDVDYVLARQTLVIEPGVEPPAWVAKAGDPEQPELWPASAPYVRRALFDRVGRYDPGFRLSEDVEWLTRAKDLGGRVGLLDETLLIRRIHGANLSYDTAGCQRGLMRALQARAARRRAAAASARDG